jgi:hypothetical protein
VVARDVEKFVSRARHAAPGSSNEGRAHRAVLERRDGIIVSRTRELGAVLGEALYVLEETSPGCCL